MSTALRQRLALLLMAASGFAGLGYQIVWTQQSALWLGHESAAVLAVVAAFFGGLGLGALALGLRIEASPRPVRWYVGCELVIAAWSLLLAVVMAPVADGLLGLVGVQPSPAWQWTVAFTGTFLLLLPATAAMGATLPAMERLAAEAQREGRSIAALYAANTLGAVAGVLAAAFWLVPELGLIRTAMVCAGLNLLCAVGSVWAFGRAVAGVKTAAEGSASTREAPETTGTLPHRALATRDTAGSSGSNATLVRLAATGLLGIGYEVLVVRVLSQVAEDTVYTFALLLAVYLVGTAIGAALWQRGAFSVNASTNTERTRDRLLGALAAACLIGTASLWGAEWLRDSAQHSFGMGTSGAGMWGALAAEVIVAFAAFALPTVVMGALFSQLTTEAHRAGVSFGRALGVNTLAAAAAPLVFGVLLVPALGAKFTLLLVASGYLALAVVSSWRRPIVWLPAAATAALAFGAPPLAFVDLPEGGKVMIYREGVMGAVSVVEDAAGVSRLRINNRQQEGSSATMLVDGRQALLPLMLHPQPQRALFLGLGTGITAATAAQDPTIRVDAVELLPEVIETSPHFTQVFGEADGEPVPRLNLMAGDARRHVRASRERYDVIVSDNFHPARSGSGSLYTVEHFGAVRERLAPSGVFCQWLPLHQLDLTTLRSIVRSFRVAFPQGMAILASNSLETPVIGLVGRADGARFDVTALRTRLAASQLPQGLASYGIDDEYALLGSIVAGPKSLAAFAGDAALNTDDHPVVAYLAPRITYAPDSLPRDRLVELLAQLTVSPDEVIADASEAPASTRLAAYWTARQRFIEVGRAVRPSGDAAAMLAQVREPLLDVLRISADFRPAYDPLLRMAMAVGRSDPQAARSLLGELDRLAPARGEAAQGLRQLAAATP